MNIIAKTSHELDVTVSLREQAVHCALAYLTALAFAFLDHIEHVTGRCDFIRRFARSQFADGKITTRRSVKLRTDRTRHWPRLLQQILHRNQRMGCKTTKPSGVSRAGANDDL